MKRFMLFVCLVVFVLTSPVFAEFEGEFGVSVDLSAFFEESTYGFITGHSYRSSYSLITAPSSLYLMFFPNKMVAISPEIKFTHDSGPRSFGGQVLFSPNNSNSNPYALIGCHLAVLSTHYAGDTHGVLGIGAGYQWRVGSVSVFRLEGLSRRYFIEDGGMSELSITFGLGARLGE